MRQDSRAACIDGETWGYDRDGIWVDRGCRGEFALGGERHADASGAVTCESLGGDRTRCAMPTRQGVRLTRQLSRTRCVQGENWDDERDHVWVDGGCRAVFTSGAGFSRGSDGADDGIGGNAVLLGLGALAVAAVAAGALGGGDSAVPEAPPAASWVEPSHYVAAAEPPGWVVGTFQGYSPLYDTGLLLSVEADGRAVAYLDDVRLTGFYQQGQLRLGGVDYAIDVRGADIVTTQLNTPGNRSVLARVR